MRIIITVWGETALSALMILQVMEIQTVLTKGARLVQIISYLGKVSRLQGDLLVSKS